MIKHIVMWKLKTQANGIFKKENMALMKERLEALNGKIPGMIRLEVGSDFSAGRDSYDIVLYSEFETRNDLTSYLNHPEHKKIMPFVAEVREDRKSVDYEV